MKGGSYSARSAVTALCFIGEQGVSIHEAWLTGMVGGAIIPSGGR